MKTSELKAVGFRFILGLGFLVAAGLASFATEDDPPLVPPELVPADGNFYSVQKFDGPPLPYNPFPDLPVYAVADNQFLVDDTGVNYDLLESLMELEPQEDGPPPESPPPPSGSPPTYGCRLWLDVAASGQTNLLLTLHNTQPGFTYVILTNADLGPLAQTNWAVATNLTGAASDFTQTVMPIADRPNLFFRASGTNSGTNFVFAFQGLVQTNTFAPVPDTMGAVGPDHFVELLNNRIAVYDKSGGPPVAQADTTNFFSIGTNSPDVGDPRILYDPQSNRWVALARERVTYQQVILAVSTNESPTNLVTGWTRHVIPLPVGNNHGDFPTLGMDGNGIYVSTLIHSGITNLGQAIVAIRKKELYEGSGPLIMTNWAITTGPPVWTIQPAVSFENVSTNAYAWFVAKGPADFGSNYQGGAILYRRLQWSGTNATLDPDWFVVTNTAYRNYYDLDGTNVSLFPGELEGVSAPQNGGGNIDLHQAGSRLAMTVIRNGFLWTCQTVGLTNSGVYSGDETGTTVDRAGVQWLKLSVDAGGGSLSYGAHGRVYDPAPSNPRYYYYPSLMVNGAGDMLMGFSGSSATNYIGAFYSWKSVSSSTAAMPRLIRAGDGAYGDKRWGDYSATTLDPTDECGFWTVQEYADASADWATVIAEIRPNP